MKLYINLMVTDMRNVKSKSILLHFCLLLGFVSTVQKGNAITPPNFYDDDAKISVNTFYCDSTQRCYGANNGVMLLKINGVKSSMKIIFEINGKEEIKEPAHNSDNSSTKKLNTGKYSLEAYDYPLGQDSFYIDDLAPGKYKFCAKREYGNLINPDYEIIIDTTVEIRPISKPYIKILEDSCQTSLHCAQDECYVSFIYGGGNKENGRVYLEHESSDDVIDLGALPSDTILRINEFKRENYKLNGNYRIVYQSKLDNCKDSVAEDFAIKELYGNKLEIIDIDEASLAEGECVADNRRIAITATGGWGDYIFSVKNVEESEQNEESEKETYGSLLDKDYVSDSRLDTSFFINKDGVKQMSVTYRSGILQPGLYEISVLDKEFCYVTGGIVEVKAKHDIEFIQGFDWCGAGNNEIKIDENIDEIDHFSLRIGHESIKKDSVEIKTNLRGSIAKDHSHYTLGNIPTGRIGIYTFMKDGCSSFSELDFERHDGFKPIKLRIKELKETLCYDDESGEILFEVNNGYDHYKSISLDGESINRFDAALISTDNDSEVSFGLLWNGILDGSKNYISIKNLPWGNFTDSDSAHYIVAVDANDCSDTLKFTLPHPDKIKFGILSTPVCFDGAGRLFATEIIGGAKPYLWSLDGMSREEYEILFDSDKQNYPKKISGNGLTDFIDYYDFVDYYVNNFQESDHLPAVAGYPHKLILKDANNCVAESEESVIDNILTWDDVNPDYLISSWHEYGDVLVVIDKTNYGKLNCDSLHVDIIMKESRLKDKIIASPQDKDQYTYGFSDAYIADEDTSTMHQERVQLIPESSAKRMSFIKLETTALGVGNIYELLSEQDDLPFTIRVTSYVNGCDIVTEYNDMHISLEGPLPYPVVNYKETLDLTVLQNPAIEGKTTISISLNKPVSQSNPLTYYTIDNAGKVSNETDLKSTGIYSESTDENGYQVFTYTIEIDGLQKETEYVFVAQTKNRIESTPILSK